MADLHSETGREHDTDLEFAATYAGYVKRMNANSGDVDVQGIDSTQTAMPSSIWPCLPCLGHG
jgi:hypothetical protein